MNFYFPLRNMNQCSGLFYSRYHRPVARQPLPASLPKPPDNYATAHIAHSDFSKNLIILSLLSINEPKLWRCQTDTKTQSTEQLSIGGYGRLRLLGKAGALQKSHCLPAGVRESAPHRESASPSQPVVGLPDGLTQFLTIT